MTKQRQMEIRADLARAMGWTERHKDYPIAPVGHILHDDYPSGKLYGWPNPFTSADDSRALLEWLAADDERFLAFRKEFLRKWSLIWLTVPSEQALSLGYYEKWLLTLPLETIAIAAAKALGIETE